MRVVPVGRNLVHEFNYELTVFAGGAHPQVTVGGRFENGVDGIVYQVEKDLLQLLRREMQLLRQGGKAAHAAQVLCLLAQAAKILRRKFRHRTGQQPANQCYRRVLENVLFHGLHLYVRYSQYLGHRRLLQLAEFSGGSGAGIPGLRRIRLPHLYRGGVDDVFGSAGCDGAVS